MSRANIQTSFFVEPSNGLSIYDTDSLIEVFNLNEGCLPELFRMYKLRRFLHLSLKV